MGIFQTLKDKIFGSAEAKEVAPPPPPPAPTAEAAPPPPPQPVDLDKVLEYMAEKRGEKLNYKSSIVDLMKLVGMDSSLAARKELAQELGYTGALDGSAEMNIWLIGKVRERLAQTTV